MSDDRPLQVTSVPVFPELARALRLARARAPKLSPEARALAGQVQAEIDRAVLGLSRDEQEQP